MFFVLLTVAAVLFAFIAGLLLGYKWGWEDRTDGVKPKRSSGF
jgi:hypothetical protein